MKMSMIKKFTLLAAAAFLVHFLFVFASEKYLPETHTNAIETINVESEPAVSKQVVSLYDSLQLGKLELSSQAFEFAFKGYNALLSSGKVKNPDVISIVDFSLPSSKKRLFIIDLKRQQLLFHTYVSHGRNSGKEKASHFSNEDGSFKSSLGFYVTSNTYEGKHGYSMRLDGKEKGLNDNALSRGIVMHSAAYVNEVLVRTQGYIGRSQGCPAVPENLHKGIIQKIKGGTCFFMYGDDKYYATHSSYLKS